MVTYKEGDDHIQGILSYETVAELDVFRAQFADRLAAARELNAALKKGERAVAAVQTKRKQAVVAARKKESAEEEKEQLLASHRAAERAAATIRDPAQQAQKRAHISNVSSDVFSAPVTLTENNSLTLELMAKPVLLAEVPAFKTWAAKEETHNCMTNYAGQFKKMTDYKETQRTQGPVKDKACAAIALKAFESFAPTSEQQVDITTVSGGGSFAKQLWMWGWSESMSRASFAPQCAALLRTLHGGHIEVYMTSTSEFVRWLHGKTAMTRRR